MGKYRRTAVRDCIAFYDAMFRRYRRSLKKLRRVATAQERAARRARLRVTLDRSVIKSIKGTVVPALLAAARKGV